MQSNLQVGRAMIRNRKCKCCHVFKVIERNIAQIYSSILQGGFARWEEEVGADTNRIER